MATLDELQAQLQSLIPAGTVVAYAGEVEDLGVPLEVKPGWLLCNGAAVSDQDYPALFQAIQASHGNGSDKTSPLPGASFNLPDYRGLFLRGVAGARTDRDPNYGDPDRPQNHPGGNVGNRVGSVQGDATKFPNRPFETKNDGAHAHNYYRWDSPKGGADENYFRLVGSENLATTVGGGEHKHQIEGGDAETRPKNAYVHWLIKT